jgi:hypothetical protein
VVLVSLVALRNMHELQWNLGEMRATLCNFTHTNFFHFPTFRLFSISLPINYRLSDSSFLRKSLWIVLLLNPVSQRRPQKAAWQQTNCSKISCTKQSRVIFFIISRSLVRTATLSCIVAFLRSICRLGQTCFYHKV